MDASEGHGRIVKFTLSDGRVETEVVLPQEFSMSSLTHDPRRKLNSLQEVERYLDAGNWRTRVTGDFGLELSRYAVSVDSKRGSGGNIYLDADIRAITGDFSRLGSRMKASLNESQFRELVPLLLRKTQLSGDLELMNKLRENSGDVKLDISDAGGRAKHPRNWMADENMAVETVEIESGKHYTLSQAEYILKKKIAESESKTGENYINAKNEQTGITARITNRRAGKYVSEKAYNKSSVKPHIHAAAVINIEKLFHAAALGVSHPNHKNISGQKDPVLQMHRFYAGMRYEGHDYGVKLSVKELRQGFNVLYTVETGDIEVSEMKKPLSVSQPGGGVDVTGETVRRPKFKFSDFFEKFKPQNDFRGTNYLYHKTAKKSRGERKIFRFRYSRRTFRMR